MPLTLLQWSVHVLHGTLPVLFVVLEGASVAIAILVSLCPLSVLLATAEGSFVISAICVAKSALPMHNMVLPFS